jgi:peroxiredoxin
MARMETPVCDFGATPPDFRLKGVDEKMWTRDQCAGTKGLLVMFICNHCPYVIGARDRIIRDSRDLAALDIGCVAINSNDTARYPEDSFENMQRIAKQFSYPFPYLFDATQDVAHAYGAVCTPDFFGYNAKSELQYRGRIDSGGRQDPPKDARRELFEAMKQVAETGRGPREQLVSIGCSIKWR